MTKSFSAQRGLIFNIQKFSVNDGPGIRTAVFIKGCPLRCRWCANPESQSRCIQITWDEARCIHCRKCVMTCPECAITQEQDDSNGPIVRSIRIDEKKCSGCQICVRGCPAQALSAEGEWKTVDEVFNICMQDLPFYEESGGGVTLSGGEVLSSPDFAIALMEQLKAEGIHIALETTGFAAPEVFDRVTSLADLLLFDMKHWNEKGHIAGTGVSNLPILSNMKRAVECGANVLPRIPVIPDFNDTLDDAKGLSARLNEIGAKRAQLLPFHQFGENKYHRLGKTYEYTDVPAYHPEDLAEYRDVFVKNGIEAFF